MVDSTEFFEVYNATGEVLQNVQPINSINEILTISLGYGILLVFLIAKKIKIKKLSF